MLFFKSNRDVHAPGGMLSSFDIIKAGSAEGCFAGATEDELQDRRKESERAYFKMKAQERIRKAKEMGLVAVK